MLSIPNVSQKCGGRPDSGIEITFMHFVVLVSCLGWLKTLESGD